MASYPLSFLVNHGAIIDISGMVDDWDVITPDMLSARIEKGDILIIHTGWHRYYEGQPQQDLVRYFCMHPGGNLDLLEWMLDMEIAWFGIDTGSGDHLMNTTIRHTRPDLAAQFEDHVGMPVREFFPPFEYTHKLSGRRVHGDMFPFHNYAFQEGLIHAETSEVISSKCSIDGASSAPFRGSSMGWNRARAASSPSSMLTRWRWGHWRRQ